MVTLLFFRQRNKSTEHVLRKCHQQFEVCNAIVPGHQNVVKQWVKSFQILNEHRVPRVGLISFLGTVLCLNQFCLFILYEFLLLSLQIYFLVCSSGFCLCPQFHPTHCNFSTSIFFYCCFPPNVQSVCGNLSFRIQHAHFLTQLPYRALVELPPLQALHCRSFLSFSSGPL